MRGQPASLGLGLDLRRRLSGRVEVDRRRREIAASFSTVKFGFGLVAEHLRRQVGRELAHRDVVVLHRLDVALARDGDAVLGALELRLQIAEVRRST